MASEEKVAATTVDKIEPPKLTQEEGLKDFSLMIQEVLPRHLVKALLLDPQSAILGGMSGSGGQTKPLLDVVSSKADCTRYVKEQNLHFNVPALFKTEAANSLGLSFPGDTLTSMSAVKEGLDEHKKHRVHQTLLLHNGQIHAEKTISEMEKYFMDGVRKCPLAMLYIPITKSKNARMYCIPSHLERQNLASVVKRRLPEFKDHSKKVSMIEESSVIRFHSQLDGAIQFLAPSQGRLLVFFLTNPTVADNDSLLKCADVKRDSKFIPDTMVGRVVCTIVEARELLIFSGRLPFAFIALDDVLLFSGRVLVPAVIPSLLEFGKKERKVKCLGSGHYDWESIKDILYKGSGKVFSFLLERKTLYEENHKKYFGIVQREFLDFMTENKTYLEMDKAKIISFNAIFGILQLKTKGIFGLDLSGVHFRRSEEPVLKPMLSTIFDFGFLRSPFNSLNDNIYRMTFPPDPSDLDFCSSSDKDRLKVAKRSYSASSFYASVFGESSAGVLFYRGGELGMYASRDLDVNTLVSEFSGHLRDDDGIQSTYHHNTPPSRCYMLSYNVVQCQKPQLVVVDANLYGGASLFYRTSATPNARVLDAVLERRKILVVLVVTAIKEGDEITIQLPMNPHVSSCNMFASPNDLLRKRKLYESMVQGMTNFPSMPFGNLASNSGGAGQLGSGAGQLALAAPTTCNNGEESVNTEDQNEDNSSPLTTDDDDHGGSEESLSQSLPAEELGSDNQNTCQSPPLPETSNKDVDYDSTAPGAVILKADEMRPRRPSDDMYSSAPSLEHPSRKGRPPSPLEPIPTGQQLDTAEGEIHTKSSRSKRPDDDTNLPFTSSPTKRKSASPDLPRSIFRTPSPEPTQPCSDPSMADETLQLISSLSGSGRSSETQLRLSPTGKEVDTLEMEEKSMESTRIKKKSRPRRPQSLKPNTHRSTVTREPTVGSIALDTINPPGEPIPQTSSRPLLASVRLQIRGPLPPSNQPGPSRPVSPRPGPSRQPQRTRPCKEKQTESSGIQRTRQYGLQPNSTKRMKNFITYKQPNDVNQKVFDELPLETRDFLKVYHPSLYFPTFEDFDKVNKETLTYYGIEKNQSKTCGLCPHHGIFIDRKSNEPGFSPFRENRALRLHWERQHIDEIICTHCDVGFRNKKGIQQHLREVEKTNKLRTGNEQGGTDEGTGMEQLISTSEPEESIAQGEEDSIDEPKTKKKKT